MQAACCTGQQLAGGRDLPRAVLATHLAFLLGASDS